MDELHVIIKAKELAVHTFKLTSNCNHYPKKFRFSLVDKMQNKSLSLYEALLEANRLSERSFLQTMAVSYCDELLFYIEMSMEFGLISPGSAEHWSKMVTDVKFMTLAWRKKV